MGMQYRYHYTVYVRVQYDIVLQARAMLVLGIRGWDGENGPLSCFLAKEKGVVKGKGDSHKHNVHGTQRGERNSQRYAYIINAQRRAGALFCIFKKAKSYSQNIKRKKRLTAKQSRSIYCFIVIVVTIISFLPFSLPLSPYLYDRSEHKTPYML